MVGLRNNNVVSSFVMQSWRRWKSCAPEPVGQDELLPANLSELEKENNAEPWAAPSVFSQSRLSCVRLSVNNCTVLLLRSVKP
jgi:hypothetical protein